MPESIHVCQVCGYRHEGAFADIPGGWCCPICNSAKAEFRPLPQAPAAGSVKPDAAARYLCLKCGYAYDPCLGLPEAGIAAGTGFADVPQDWCCPICQATKIRFAREV